MKNNVAIIAGGNSKESVISIQSADVVLKNIDSTKFSSYIIVINGNDWYYKNDDKIKVDKNDFSITIHGEKILFDIAFIAIHGTPGEDGLLQAYFDLVGLPYTSSGMLTSALTFNKIVCNDLVEKYGILVGKTILLSKKDIIDKESIIKEVGLPCFVKPNKGGSSIGISKVSQINELENAIKKAFEQDNETIIQKFIEGREITCGVFSINNELNALPITEIVSQNDFFDYEAKYLGKSKEITPAQISENVEKECKATSIYLYKKLNCKGVVRFDYILNNNRLCFLEVNTVPGLSESSLIPQQVKSKGILIKDFFTILLEEALRNRQ
jgi:D-alanine-D-alanine ligase